MTSVRRAELADVDAVRRIGLAGLGREDGFWVMWTLYVLPGHQRKGAGKALLDVAVAALPDGTPELLLDVLVTNDKAIDFYRSQGFGEPERKPARDLGDELTWMSLDLDRT